MTGVQIWLRHNLYWEAPIEFTRWLYQQTGGLPGQLKRGLDVLIAQKTLRYTRGDWTCPQDFASFPLAERLTRYAGPPMHLPSGLTLFVGRATEVRELHRLTHSERLVTLVGPGGMGKSRLAIQVAAERREDFADGIFFVPLAAVSGVEYMIPALAEATRYQFLGKDISHKLR